MIAYLLKNNELEAALKLGSKKSFETELLNGFSTGNKRKFFQIFNLLSANSKLQFYLHVYFLIYDIHPNLAKQQHISKESLKDFKQYIDNKGSELAKTNQFLEFYALPYIKQPLQHPNFKTLFKKDWVQNLKQKLKIFIKQENKRITEQSQNFRCSNGKTSQQNQRQSTEQLYKHIDEYAEKYKSLEAEYRSIIAVTNSNMMQSQCKWHQIVKQVVQCSRSLINLISRHNKQLTSQRKFLNIRKKIDRFQKFVNQKIEDMMSSSQDISIFDRPSINQISCTIAATQKSYSNNFPDLNPLTIEQYVPFNFNKVIQSFSKSNSLHKEKNLIILKGLVFRIIKSKDPFIRRQHIIGIIQSDILGIKSGLIKNYLLSHLKQHFLLLMSYIEVDFYGRNTLFTPPIIKQLIHLVKSQSQNKLILQYIVLILQQLSIKESIKLELINNDMISFYINLLRTRLDDLNDSIVQQISTTLLNLTSRPQGLDKFQEQDDLFFTFGLLLESENPIVRMITNGTIYNLLGRKKIYQQAFEVGLNQIIAYLIEHDNKANLKQLKFIQDRLITFTPSKVITRDIHQSDDTDEIFDEDNIVEYEDDMINIEEYLRAHETLVRDYGLPRDEGIQQTLITRNILDTSLRRLKQRKSLELIENQSKKFRSNIKQKEVQREKVRQEHENKQKAMQKLFVSPQQSLVNNYLSPRPKLQRQSQIILAEKNDSSLHVAKFASVVVEPVANFSPSSKIRSRQHIVQKLNNQIKARKQLQVQSRRKQNSQQKLRHYSFNENKHNSLIQNNSRHSKAYQKTQQYKQAFGAKPKITRSPPTSPR